jgi:hypothetical protein
METRYRPVFHGIRAALAMFWLLMASGVPDVFAREAAAAESGGRLAGFYKVVASNDPQFPATRTREYFLDFGKGIQPSRLSGSVAISLRENPSVRVRILAWQYFPKDGTLVIGNPFAEGSRRAVAAGVWKLRANSKGAVLQRDRFQVVLHRADPENS